MTSQRIVVMGVAGCGKTSVGRELADRLGTRFLDGDDYHPAANVAKMSAGTALTDEDRWPWLDRLGAVTEQAVAETGGAVLACSALRRVYRERLQEAARGAVMFVHLAGTQALIEQRMAARTGHFMPTGLLDSQFATLEPPGPDETALSIDVDAPLDEIVDRIARALTV